MHDVRIDERSGSTLPRLGLPQPDAYVWPRPEDQAFVCFAPGEIGLVDARNGTLTIYTLPDLVQTGVVALERAVREGAPPSWRGTSTLLLEVGPNRIDVYDRRTGRHLENLSALLGACTALDSQGENVWVCDRDGAVFRVADTTATCVGTLVDPTQQPRAVLERGPYVLFASGPRVSRYTARPWRYVDSCVCPFSVVGLVEHDARALAYGKECAELAIVDGKLACRTLDWAAPTPGYYISMVSDAAGLVGVSLHPRGYSRWRVDRLASEQRVELAGPPDVRPLHVRGLDDGRYLYAGGPMGEVVVWRPTPGSTNYLGEVRPHDDGLVACDWTSSVQRTLRLYDAVTASVRTVEMEPGDVWAIGDDRHVHIARGRRVIDADAGIDMELDTFAISLAMTGELLAVLTDTDVLLRSLTAHTQETFEIDPGAFLQICAVRGRRALLRGSAGLAVLDFDARALVGRWPARPYEIDAQGRVCWVDSPGHACVLDWTAPEPRERRLRLPCDSAKLGWASGRVAAYAGRTVHLQVADGVGWESATATWGRPRMVLPLMKGIALMTSSGVEVFDHGERTWALPTASAACAIGGDGRYVCVVEASGQVWRIDAAEWQPLQAT